MGDGRGASGGLFVELQSHHALDTQNRESILWCRTRQRKRYPMNGTEVILLAAVTGRLYSTAPTQEHSIIQVIPKSMNLFK